MVNIFKNFLVNNFHIKICIVSRLSFLYLKVQEIINNFVKCITYVIHLIIYSEKTCWGSNFFLITCSFFQRNWHWYLECHSKRCMGTSACCIKNIPIRKSSLLKVYVIDYS